MSGAGAADVRTEPSTASAGETLTRTTWIRAVLTAGLVSGVAVAGCSGPDVGSDSSGPDGSPTVQSGGPVEVIVDASDPGRPLDRRLFGTNVPAWLGPERLADPGFRALAVESGATVARMPGGSWSNSYDWAACEVGDQSQCFWTWAARPSDFAGFLGATGLAGMWTVSINETAQSAAAAVAFFNGDVGDMTSIGVDRHGVEWGTVDRWARLRDTGGNPAPVRIALWEIGNEVYGGKPAAGGEGCAPFGWEEVWTCDGDAYVKGDDGHDGYLAIRRAMLAVDPSIDIGAVGVSPPEAWNEWGAEVLESVGDELDFYVVHQYGFDTSPTMDDALSRPAELWPDLINGVRSVTEAPLAVTEYNLVSVESGDDRRTMTQAVNALFIANTLGQFASAGVQIANQWNLANGTTSSGTDYGMVSADDDATFPQFESMRLWSRAGGTLLPVQIATRHRLSVYPTRHDDGTVTVVVVNLDGDDVAVGIEMRGGPETEVANVELAAAHSLDSSGLDVSATTVTSVDGRFTVPIPGWSVTVIETGRDG